MRFDEISFELDETVGEKGLAYELQVYKSIVAAKVPGLSPGDKPAAGFSNVGAGDIEATYNGKPFNIEIKLNSKAQMGGGQLIYDRASETVKPHPNMVAKTDPDDLNMILDAAESKREAINTYLDELMFRGVDTYGFPCMVPKNIRDQMTADGVSRPVNAVVRGSTKYIISHYNKKGVYYIQMGGAGLFYLGSDPLKLGVPAFDGEARIEMRIKYAGATANKAGVKPTSRRAEWVAIGRLVSNLKSPYTLDTVEGVQALFSKNKMEDAAGVGRITKQNQTVDVGPNEVAKQAAKFGNKVSKDGVPPLLGSKKK